MPTKAKKSVIYEYHFLVAVRVLLIETALLPRPAGRSI